MIEVHSLRRELTYSCRFSLDTEGQGACLLLFYLNDVVVGLHISWCEVLPCKVYTSSWLILPSQFQAQFQFRFQSEVLFSIWAEEVEAGLGVFERQFHTRPVHDPGSGWVGPGGARFIRNERNSQGTESLSGPNSRFWIPKWDWGHLDKSWVVPVPICTRINAPEKSSRKIHIRLTLRCWGNSSIPGGRFSKWF